MVVAALAASSCRSRTVDLQKTLQVTDVVTGWFDAGIVEGNKNKLVPSISIRLKNTDTQPIASVEMIAKFSRVGEPEEWGSAPFVRAIGPDGLGPGQTGPPLVMRCDRGYTGEETRSQMLQNSHFVDARVELFAKYMSSQYVKLGEFRIARQLLTQ
jgi:hypothetical protein